MPAGQEPERERRGGTVLFVSDVHLTPREPEVFRLFCRFLDEAATGAAALYILGDLFDFWVGPRQGGIPGYGEVFQRTRSLRESGTDVFFLPGNRDFLLTGAWATAQGLRVLPDVAHATLGGRRVLLTHGDLLCTRDVAYQRMRRILRSGPVRSAIRAMPFWLAIRLADRFRDASGVQIRKKPSFVLDPDFEEARSWLANGYDALIFGHVHRGERYRVRLPDRVADIFVLGAWEDVPNYVSWDGADLELRTYVPG